MFVSPAFSTPTRPMTSPQSSPFTPPNNFNKVSLSASSAQQQRQGVSWETFVAQQRGVQVLFEEINDSQLLGYMPCLGEDLDVGVRLRSLDSMIKTLQGLRNLFNRYFEFLYNDENGIDAIEDSTLYNSYSKWIDTISRTLTPAEINVPFSQLLKERKKAGFESLLLAQKFQDLATQVDAKLQELTSRHTNLQKSAFEEDHAIGMDMFRSLAP